MVLAVVVVAVVASLLPYIVAEGLRQALFHDESASRDSNTQWTPERSADAGVDGSRKGRD